MILYTKTDKELYAVLQNIKDEPFFIKFIFDYCENQQDREKLLGYINSGHKDRKEVLLMASQIGIESGTVEGELIDDEEET